MKDNNPKKNSEATERKSVNNEYNNLMKNELMKGICESVEKNNEVFSRAFKAFMKDKD